MSVMFFYTSKSVNLTEKSLYIHEMTHDFKTFDKTFGMGDGSLPVARRL